jgi:hypothetical protein
MLMGVYIIIGTAFIYHPNIPEDAKVQNHPFNQIISTSN